VVRGDPVSDEQARNCHERFQKILDKLLVDREGRSAGVGTEVFGKVLARVSLRSPEETSRAHIARGKPEAVGMANRDDIAQATVSKAVKALKDPHVGVELLEDGVTPLLHESRPVAPLRFGTCWVIAGVHIRQLRWRPQEVTTVLFNMDTEPSLRQVTREVPIAITESGQDDSENTAALCQATAELVHAQVNELLEAEQVERSTRLKLLGVGVEVGTPVRNGKIFPAPSEQPIDFAAALQALFAADDDMGLVPIIVENDVNALTVLAIHERKYTKPDLVMVAVFDEGVGGGLVMDGQLRRGGTGRAMELGHLTVGYPPGKRARLDVARSSPDAPVTVGFDSPCQCGKRGHVDTLATPSRILGQLGATTFNVADFEKAAALPAVDANAELTKEGDVFMRAGAALGRAVAHVCNIVNPSTLVIKGPKSLADPKEGSAGAAYFDAAVSEIRDAFATPSRRLPVEELPSDSKQLAKDGAKAAAVCVLQSFIEHALGIDGCTKADKPEKKRSAQTSDANEPPSTAVAPRSDPVELDV
jgi:predicted NBD/HSP70 family sugar kinase